MDLQHHHPEAAPYIMGEDDSVTVSMAEHYPGETPRFQLPPPGGIPPDMGILYRAQARAANATVEEQPLVRVPSRSQRREFRPRFVGQPEQHGEDEDDGPEDDMALIAARPQLLDAVSSSPEGSGDGTSETAWDSNGSEAALVAIVPRPMETVTESSSPVM